MRFLSVKSLFGADRCRELVQELYQKSRRSESPEDAAIQASVMNGLEAELPPTDEWRRDDRLDEVNHALFRWAAENPDVDGLARSYALVRCIDGRRDFESNERWLQMCDPFPQSRTSPAKAC